MLLITMPPVSYSGNMGSSKISGKSSAAKKMAHPAFPGNDRRAEVRRAPQVRVDSQLRITRITRMVSLNFFRVIRVFRSSLRQQPSFPLTDLGWLGGMVDWGGVSPRSPPSGRIRHERDAHATFNAAPRRQASPCSPQVRAPRRSCFVLHERTEAAGSSGATGAAGWAAGFPPGREEPASQRVCEVCGRPRQISQPVFRRLPDPASTALRADL